MTRQFLVHKWRKTQQILFCFWNAFIKLLLDKSENFYRQLLKIKFAVSERNLDICHILGKSTVQIDLIYKIIFQNLRYKYQSFDIYTLAIENVIQWCTGTIYTTGEFCIAHTLFIDLLANYSTDISVFHATQKLSIQAWQCSIT